MTAMIVSDVVDLSVTATIPVQVGHGLGREVGFLCIWADDYVQFKVDANASDQNTLVLIPDVTCNARLVLL
ncbi:MAG: hypothetical protein OEZ43_21045 [Gammaproteobacteria bacterium]|nr:hypothetical protein [Gammaproteobacteria bacterium]